MTQFTLKHQYSIEISRDVAGTTVLSTTSGVNIIAGTFYTGTI
jgi:hypothetical protein